jgi:hypothetical protein
LEIISDSNFIRGGEVNGDPQDYTPLPQVGRKGLQEKFLRTGSEVVRGQNCAIPNVGGEASSNRRQSAL